MSRRVVAVAVAVLLAVVGVAAVVLYANGADQRAVAGAQPRTVFVSDRAVPSGTALTAAVASGLIRQTVLPAKAVPEGALTAVTDQNKDLLAVNDIPPGEYILAARFGTTPQGSQAIRVPSGKIAVSVTLSDPARVGSFVAPGSQIVLYQTTQTAPAGTSSSAGSSGGWQTRVLFDKVQVIGVGSTALAGATPTGQETAPSNQSGALVTLALTPDEAPRLVRAVQAGQLYAGLLSGDAKVDTGLVVTDANAFGR